jgi:hypothetical protein
MASLVGSVSVVGASPSLLFALSGLPAGVSDCHWTGFLRQSDPSIHPSLTVVSILLCLCRFVSLSPFGYTVSRGGDGDSVQFLSLDSSLVVDSARFGSLVLLTQSPGTPEWYGFLLGVDFSPATLPPPGSNVTVEFLSPSMQYDPVISVYPHPCPDGPCITEFSLRRLFRGLDLSRRVYVNLAESLSPGAFHADYLVGTGIDTVEKFLSLRIGVDGGRGLGLFVDNLLSSGMMVTFLVPPGTLPRALPKTLAERLPSEGRFGALLGASPARWAPVPSLPHVPSKPKKKRAPRPPGRPPPELSSIPHPPPPAAPVIQTQEIFTAEVLAQLDEIDVPPPDISQELPPPPAPPVEDETADEEPPHEPGNQEGELMLEDCPVIGNEGVKVAAPPSKPRPVKRKKPIAPPPAPSSDEPVSSKAINNEWMEKLKEEIGSVPRPEAPVSGGLLTKTNSLLLLKRQKTSK